MMNQKLSEYHTGYHCISAEVIRAIRIDANSDDFVFDNQMLAQILYKGYEIGEVTCPTKCFDEASSIFRRSNEIWFGVLGTGDAHTG